jgi:hypothetical protein
MPSSIGWWLYPSLKRRFARHGNPSVLGTFLARWTPQSLSSTHALELDAAFRTGGPLKGAVNPRFNLHSLDMHGAVLVNEALNQNDIAGLKPTGQAIDGASLNVRENGCSIRVNPGMLSLRVDNNLNHHQAHWRVKMITTGLVGAKHGRPDARFRSL